MNYNYIFPGSVLLLKFLFKLGVDNEVGLPDLIKAMLAFPVDVAFLSLSFGAAFLYDFQNSGKVTDVKEVISFVISATVIAYLTCLICRKSERAANRDRYILGGICCLLSYTIAGGALWVSLHLHLLA